MTRLAAIVAISCFVATTALAASLEDIKAICNCESAKCQKELFSYLSDDDAYVRSYAASCLANLKSVDQKLLSDAVNSKDERVLALALRVYAKHGSCNGVLATYLDSESAAIRTQAAYAAGELKCASLASKLEEILWDRHISVRAQAISALGKIGDRSKLPKVLAFLNSPHNQVAQAAVVAASRFGNDAIPSLERFILNGETPTLRVRAAIALASIATPEATKSLGKILDSRDKYAAGAVLFALKYRTDKKLVPKIKRYIDDDTKFGRYGKLSELAKAALESQK